MTRISLTALLLACTGLAAAGCAADPSADTTEAVAADELRATSDQHWFYSGPIPTLENATVTASLKGATARVSGYLPAGAPLDEILALPHVKATAEGDRTRLDIVYPIAIARPGKYNSRPGTYSFHLARPYRPDGVTYTVSEGNHWVTWGGFPFLAYNGGIAFHGPITSKDNLEGPDMDVWYLRRGTVSGGCNRMMGEHVVELAHAIGVNMRKVWRYNHIYSNPSTAKTIVKSDYDVFDGKYVDVDYATDTGITRPATVHGRDKVEMFGSWVAADYEDGRDLPPSMAWEGGVTGKYYVFAEHLQNDMVCSFAKGDVAGLDTVARSIGGTLPRSVCAKKACIVDAIRSNAADRAAALCGL